MTPDSWVRSGYTVFWSRPGPAQHEYQLLAGRRQRPRRLRRWLPVSVVSLLAVVGFATLGLLRGPGARLRSPTGSGGDPPPAGAGQSGSPPASADLRAAKPDHNGPDVVHPVGSDSDQKGTSEHQGSSKPGQTGSPPSDGSENGGPRTSSEGRGGQTSTDTGKSAPQPTVSDGGSRGPAGPPPSSPGKPAPAPAPAAAPATTPAAAPAPAEQQDVARPTSAQAGRTAPEEVLVVLGEQKSPAVNTDPAGNEPPASLD